MEAEYPVAVAVVVESGAVPAESGDGRGRDFFLRPSIKPVQVAVADRNGADPGWEQLASLEAVAAPPAMGGMSPVGGLEVLSK